MEQDRGFDNPFSAFGDLNFNIDEGTPEETKRLELNEQDLQETQESLALVPQNSEILAVRPNERMEVSEMSQDEITSELAAYSMPSDCLPTLSSDTQARLLESLRQKQDITEYQAIGAMQLNGEILPPKLLKESNELSELGVKSELLTPAELNKIHRFAEYRPEDTDSKLRIILDVLTQSRNGVFARRDYADVNSSYYNQTKSEKIENIVDKINAYLKEGGYNAHEEDPEFVSDEERAYLIEEYGDDPAFTHCNRSELIELGYIDESKAEVLGPLSNDDLSFINSVVAPSYASKVSHRSIEQVSDYYPDAKRFYSHSDRVSDLETAMLGKYIEKEVADKRTVEPKALICAFIALEKDFFESDFSQKIKAFLTEKPNENIENTLLVLRRKFMHGGRYCNLILNGSDAEARKEYGTMITTDSAFLDNILDRAENTSDDDYKRKLELQSGFIVKLDGIFDEVRIAYSGLKAVLEAQSENESNEAEAENSPRGINSQAIHRMLEINSRAIDDSQFTGEADITLPNNSSNN